MKKLEIGCGEKPRSGYIHFDIRKIESVDFVGNAKKLPFKENEFSEIYSRFFLEHLPRNDAKKALKEMFRVLAPGGRLEIIVPNLAHFCKLFLEGNAQEKEWSLNKIYGFEKYEEDHHYFGYNFETLKKFLEEAGFVEIKRIKTKEGEAQRLGVEALKPEN
ncbi:MAG: methyltransferase domain-containing protein [Candidatus Diapherotrites archaeon]|nr:methyltransferase domain-containing protein [Candidatus Diapherotrites archaeon]